MKTILAKVLILSVAGAGLGVNAAESTTLIVQTDKAGARINPAMWGVFFEDINFGADGGLYAELVKNRGFEFPDALMGWTKLSPGIARGSLSIHNESPFNSANAHYLRIESQSNVPFGVANEGFRGMEEFGKEKRTSFGTSSECVRFSRRAHRTLFRARCFARYCSLEGVAFRVEEGQCRAPSE